MNDIELVKRSLKVRIATLKDQMIYLESILEDIDKDELLIFKTSDAEIKQ